MYSWCRQGLTRALAQFAVLEKQAPLLTFWQALLLVAAVLPLQQRTPQEALERVRYIQAHNYTAYLSHCRRILERLDGLRQSHAVVRYG